LKAQIKALSARRSSRAPFGFLVFRFNGINGVGLGLKGAQFKNIRRAFIVFASRSFSRLLAFHFHAFDWQLATSPAATAPSYHFPFHKSIFADHSTIYFRRPSSPSHLALFPRRLALCFHAFEWQLATSPAGSALSYHFPLHDSILADLSTLHFRQSFIVFAPRFISRRLSLSLRHPSVVPSIGTSTTSRVPLEALKSPLVPFMPFTGEQNPDT
jgi:hypothetical protein